MRIRGRQDGAATSLASASRVESRSAWKWRNDVRARAGCLGWTIRVMVRPRTEEAKKQTARAADADRGGRQLTPRTVCPTGLSSFLRRSNSHVRHAGRSPRPHRPVGPQRRGRTATGAGCTRRISGATIAAPASAHVPGRVAEHRRVFRIQRGFDRHGHRRSTARFAGHPPSMKRSPRALAASLLPPVAVFALSRADPARRQALQLRTTSSGIGRETQLARIPEPRSRRCPPARSMTPRTAR